jgi:hypothetical protein
MSGSFLLWLRNQSPSRKDLQLVLAQDWDYLSPMCDGRNIQIDRISQRSATSEVIYSVLGSHHGS